jgi:hypothetical protein
MPEPTPALPDRTTCRIHGLTAFAPGFHKSQLFTADDTARMVAAFQRLRGHLTPHAKLGHDTQQRLKLSLGFPSLGDVVAVRADSQGRPVLDLENVPVEIGQAINGNKLRSVSIEVVPEAPDPADASVKIPGPILTAVSFLGEEQPAVKGLPPIPKATFADGSEVPPANSAAPWLTAMADVLKHSAGFSETYKPSVVIAGRTLAVSILSFSDWTPAETPTVTPEEIVAAFLALPPEAQAVVLPQLAASGAGPTPATVPPEKMAEVPAPNVPTPAPVPGATMSDDNDADDKMFAETCKKFAADPNATPEQKMMSQMYSAFSSKFAGMTKKFGDVSAAVQAKEKDSEAAKMSAFTSEYDATFKANDGPLKLAPQEAKALRETHLELAKTSAFSTADSRKGIISGLETRLKGLPIDPRLKITPAVGSDGKPLPRPPVQPTETLNILTGPGSFLAGQVNSDAMRQRLGLVPATVG